MCLPLDLLKSLYSVQVLSQDVCAWMFLNAFVLSHATAMPQRLCLDVPAFSHLKLLCQTFKHTVQAVHV